MTLHHLANIQELKYKKKQYSLPDIMEKTVDTIQLLYMERWEFYGITTEILPKLLNIKS